MPDTQRRPGLAAALAARRNHTADPNDEALDDLADLALNDPTAFAVMEIPDTTRAAVKDHVKTLRRRIQNLERAAGRTPRP